VSSRSFLFVYGTLKSSFENRFARSLRREARLLGRAHMPGRLYRVRWYPGMRPPRDAGDLVTGELYRLRQPLSTLGLLDRYEGTPYSRELRTAVLATGETFRAWVYMYRQRLPEERRVDSGEWLADS
jgi:gamma-glutamylcyclotransferase (GGCT)/AIG2-like uncharacterized protein YtfP